MIFDPKKDRVLSLAENALAELVKWPAYTALGGASLLDYLGGSSSERNPSSSKKSSVLENSPNIGEGNVEEPSPEDSSVKTMQDVMNGILQENGQEPFFDMSGEPAPSQKPVERTPSTYSDKSIWEKADPSYLAMASKIFQSPGKSYFETFGAGLDAYMNSKKEIAGGQMAARQQEFDNMMEQIKASSYSTQNDIQKARLAYDLEKLPLEKGKLQAEILKLREEGNQTTDPRTKKIIDSVMKTIESNGAMFQTPEDVQKLVENTANAYDLASQMTGQEGSSTSLGNISEENIQHTMKKHGLTREQVLFELKNRGMIQ
jgi:hypothetical protein